MSIVTLLIFILLFAVVFAIVQMLPLDAKPRQIIQIAVAIVLVIFLALVLLGHGPTLEIR
jgi:hypothetical protein